MTERTKAERSKANDRSSNPRDVCDRCGRWMRMYAKHGTPDGPEVQNGRRFFGANSKDAKDESCIDAVWCVRCQRETGRMPEAT